MNKIHIVIGLALVLGLSSCGLSKSVETTVPESDTKSAVSTQDTEITSDKMEEESTESDAMMEKEMDSEGEKMMEQQDPTAEATMEKKIDAKEEKQEASTEGAMKKEDAMKKDEGAMMDKKMEEMGTYAAYSEDMLGKTDNTVIFFHASWCSSCRAADSNISAEKIPAGLTILKADYVTEIALKKKYKVVGQHTFVQVDADGNMLGKWLGGTDIASIEKNLK